MWRKKTHTEIENDKNINYETRRKEWTEQSLITSKKMFFAVFIIQFLSFLFYGVDAPNIPGSKYDPIPFYEMPNYFIELIMPALIIGLISFLYKLREGKKNDFYSKYSTVICNKCFRTKNFDKKLNCECGGTFENLDKYEWIEDK